MMKPFTFASFINSNLNLEEGLMEAMTGHCQERTYDTGEFLSKEGDKSPYVFFVEEGLLRKYGTDEKGKEHILQFGPENWFVTNRESSYMNKPAHFFIQALEKSRVLLLEEAFFTRLGEEVTGFNAFNTRLLHNHIYAQNKRIYELLSATAEERYLSFIRTYPDILLRVPQWMVASYLGITPESLSRVRRDLARRNFKPRS